MTESNLILVEEEYWRANSSNMKYENITYYKVLSSQKTWYYRDYESAEC